MIASSLKFNELVSAKKFSSSDVNMMQGKHEKYKHERYSDPYPLPHSVDIYYSENCQ